MSFILPPFSGPISELVAGTALWYQMISGTGLPLTSQVSCTDFPSLTTILEEFVIIMGGSAKSKNVSLKK